MKKTGLLLLLAGLVGLTWSSFFPEEFYYDYQRFFCAICNGRNESREYFAFNSFLFRRITEVSEVDPFYLKYINEEHTHLWVEENCCKKRFQINGSISLLNKFKTTEEGPGQFETTIYNSALKMAKIEFYKGNRTMLIEPYYEGIKELMKIPSLEELNSRNKEISQELRNYEENK